MFVRYRVRDWYGAGGKLSMDRSAQRTVLTDWDAMALRIQRLILQISPPPALTVRRISTVLMMRYNQ